MSSPSPAFLQTLHRLAITGFALFLLLSLALAFHYRTAFKIETDLRSITPHFIANQDLETVVNRLSTNVERQFYLVLKSQNEDDLELAGELVAEWLEREQPAEFRLVSATQNFAAVADMLLQYRYQLLSEEQAAHLQNSTDQELLLTAERRLYSLSSGVRLFGIGEDPLGLLGDYATTLAEQLGAGGGETIAVEQSDGAYYYLPILFRVNDDAGSFDQQHNILYQIDVLERHLLDGIDGLQFLHSGVVFFAAEASTAAKADITLISIGSTLGIFLLIIIIFRSIGPLILPLVSIVMGVAAAFLYCQILFGSIHIITIVFGASLIGVVIDYSLHYCYHFSSSSDYSTRSKLYKALLLSLVTSVIGYGALMFSGLDVLKQVAAFSAIGLAVAWSAVLLLGRYLLPPHNNVHDVWLRGWIALLMQHLQKISRPVFLTTLLPVMVASVIVILTWITAEDNPRSFINPNPALLEQQIELQDLLSQYEPATFLVVRRPSTQALFDVMASLQSSLNEAEQDPLFGFDAFLPAPQSQQRNYQINARLYANSDLGEDGGIALRFLRDKGMEVSRIQALQQEYQQANNKALTPEILFANPQIALPPLWQQQGDWQYSILLIPQQTNLASLQQFADNHSDVWLIDSVAMSTEAIAHLRVSAMELLGVALLLVVLLLFVRYRTVSGVALVLVPTSSILITLAVFATFNQPILLFHVMALFLVLGLGMDYVIFSYDLYDEPLSTLSAVMLSSLTSVLAFGLLSLSQLPVVSAFGATVLIGIVVNTVGSFIVISFRNSSLRQKSGV